MHASRAGLNWSAGGGEATHGCMSSKSILLIFLIGCLSYAECVPSTKRDGCISAGANVVVNGIFDELVCPLPPLVCSTHAFLCPYLELPGAFFFILIGNVPEGQLLVGSYHSSFSLHVAEVGGLPLPLRINVLTPFAK